MKRLIESEIRREAGEADEERREEEREKTE